MGAQIEINFRGCAKGMCRDETMKYVMLRLEMGGVERDLPIIFPSSLVHASVFEAIRSMREFVEPVRWHRPLADAVAVAAGELTMGDVCCSGKSETLKLTSRHRDDARIILMNDYLHGIKV
jgi:hypothetical protein